MRWLPSTKLPFENCYSLEAKSINSKHNVEHKYIEFFSYSHWLINMHKIAYLSSPTYCQFVYCVCSNLAFPFCSSDNRVCRVTQYEIAFNALKWFISSSNIHFISASAHSVAFDGGKKQIL